MMFHEVDWYTWVCECAADVDGFARERSGLTPDNIASLTGQDKRALKCVAALWELAAMGDDNGRECALAAVKAVCRYGMQRTAWPVARALIAFAMDWNDIEKLWPQVQP